MNPEPPTPENGAPGVSSPHSSSETVPTDSHEEAQKPRENPAHLAEPVDRTPEPPTPQVERVEPLAEPVISSVESADSSLESAESTTESAASSAKPVELAPEQASSTPEKPDNPALSLSFSPPPDAPFQSSLALSLICASPTAQIRYALGAHDVGQNALIFDPKDKILLTSTVDIAARAFENGQRGPLLSGTFEIKKAVWHEVEPTDQSDATPHKLGKNGVCDDGWRVSAGSVRGKLHAHRGLWREDSFEFSSVRNGEALWQIVAVSDGAGSAPLSRVGSKVACEAAVTALENSLSQLPVFSLDKKELAERDLPLLRDALTQATGAALDAIRAEASKRGKPLTAFAATLLIFVRREWNGEQLCGSVQVGDGAIALLDGAGLTLLGVADHGQHSSETRFLTTNGVEAEFASRIKFSIKPDLRAFALMSDGVSDDYFPEEKWLGGVFDAVLPRLQSESDGGAALISWLGYERKGSSDDRTLVVSWKQDAPAEAAEPEAQHGDSDRNAR